SCRTRVDCRSSDYAGYRRTKISHQTEFLCEDGGAAVLVARCCCQERGHDIFTIAIEWCGSGEGPTVRTSGTALYIFLGTLLSSGDLFT
ncbi:unnamed protein product, partial [Ascophyllum nodosum]